MIDIAENDLSIELYKEVLEFFKKNSFTRHGLKMFDLGRNWGGMKACDGSVLGDIDVGFNIDITESPTRKNTYIYFDWQFFIQPGSNGGILTISQTPDELVEKIAIIDKLVYDKIFRRHKIPCSYPGYRKDYCEVYVSSTTKLFTKENVEKEIYFLHSAISKTIPEIRTLIKPPIKKGRM